MFKYIATMILVVVVSVGLVGCGETELSGTTPDGQKLEMEMPSDWDKQQQQAGKTVPLYQSRKKVVTDRQQVGRAYHEEGRLIVEFDTNRARD